MPYTLDHKDNGFIVTHTGIITIEEINEANGRIHGHEGFDLHRYQIINALDADFSKITHSHARMPGATDSIASRTRSNVQVAILVEEPTAARFCEHYIETAKRMGSSWEFQIFADLRSAREWVLGQGGFI